MAEQKAQLLLLAVNGVFVTLFFGALLSNAAKVHSGRRGLGPVAWGCGSVFVIALIGAISCAALSLWSLHGRTRAEFDRLGVDPEDPATYRPEVLWYFGYLAQLRPDHVEERLRLIDQDAETDTLSYHLIDLSSKILRKYRYVNAGWAFTSLGLLALVATAASYLVRAQQL